MMAQAKKTKLEMILSSKKNSHKRATGIPGFTSKNGRFFECVCLLLDSGSVGAESTKSTAKVALIGWVTATDLHSSFRPDEPTSLPTLLESEHQKVPLRGLRL